MSASHERRLPSPQRRTTIERAAARLFAERGFEGTTIAAIAAETRVTKPIVYRHFDSKQDLYLALLERHAERLAAFPAPAAGQLADRAHLRGLLDGWFAYAADNRHVWRMVFEDRGGGEAIERRRLALRARARALLADLIGTARPRLAPEQRLARAEQLRSGLVGLTLWWLDHPELGRGQVLDVAAEAVLPALALDPG